MGRAVSITDGFGDPNVLFCVSGISSYLTEIMGYWTIFAIFEQWLLFLSELRHLDRSVDLVLALPSDHGSTRVSHLGLPSHDGRRVRGKTKDRPEQ
jgi:hypothetical protein